jgi:predicted site-specific integrase-resolvase
MIDGHARVSTDRQRVEAQVRRLRAAVVGEVFRELASGANTERAQPPRSLWRATAIGRTLYVKVQSLPWMSADRPHR